MRVLFGMMLGALLTVFAAYIHDSARTGEAGLSRNMVNWEIVSENWQAAKTGVQRGWTQLSAKLNS